MGSQAEGVELRGGKFLSMKGSVSKKGPYKVSPHCLGLLSIFSWFNLLN